MLLQKDSEKQVKEENEDKDEEDKDGEKIGACVGDETKDDVGVGGDDKDGEEIAADLRDYETDVKDGKHMIEQ
jgi:hypothetical protein